MITAKCFIEPVCYYSDERNEFAISEYSGTIAYEGKYFSAEMKQEKDLSDHFKKLLQEQYGLLPEKIRFKFVESPEDL